MTDISVTYIDHMGTDLSVVNAARVSFDKMSEWYYPGIEEKDCPIDQLSDRRLSDRDAKLIAYLAKHNHKSPFNHCFASFRVKAPIFVARQLVKHEYMPWNEVSRRYVDSEPEFYTPPVWRKKADNVKQGSSDEPCFMASTANHRIFTNDEGWQSVETTDYAEHALAAYKSLLEAGVCLEQARMVLPQSMMTEWIWSGTLFAIAKMYNLRIDAHTQQETQIVAKLIGDKMAELYPVSWNALVGEKANG